MNVPENDYITPDLNILTWITIRSQILKQNLMIQGYVAVDWIQTAEDRTKSRLWWIW